MILAIEAAAYAFAAWRLLALGLMKRQPGLALFLLFGCLSQVTASAAQKHSALYFWTYIGLTLIDNVISVIAVRESLALVLDDYPGIRSVSRWTMYGAVIAALVSSLAIDAAYWRSDVRTNLYYIEVANRSVVFSLTVVVASLLIFLSHYPLNLSRNRLVSSVAFGALFLSEAATLFADSMARHLYLPLADEVGSLFGAACLIGWGVMLRHEEAVARQPRPVQPGEDHLLRQLQALERAASKVSH